MAVARMVPPLNSLHVFEVASSVGSFTKAAELLSVTPSAVSRQISALESFLNVRLFNRGRDGNALTPAGEEYHREIEAAFEARRAGTDRLKRGHDKARVDGRVVSTFISSILVVRA